MPNQPDCYVVIGQPVAHSRSPAIHERFAQATGQVIRYERLPAPSDDFAAAIGAFFDDGGRGANVTLPFKAEAAGYADELAERARVAGAANTLIRNADNRIVADNTDGIGLVRDIANRLGASISNADILILGAGGAVRGAVPALLAEAPARITIANRTLAKAEAIVEAVGGRVEATTPEALDRSFDIVINAVSAGLSGDMPSLPEIVIGPQTSAYDMIYADTVTPFIQWASARHAARVCDGFGMLVEQAAESFYIWRGIRPDTAPIISALAPNTSG